MWQNQSQFNSRQSHSGRRKLARIWKWKWVLSMHFKEWKGHIQMTGFPFISNLCLTATRDSIHGHLYLRSTKTKTWRHEDCQWESVSAKLRKKPHLLWGTRGLCFAGEQKDRLCVMNATMKMRAEAVASLVQSHKGLLIQHRSHIPGKTNTSGIKTPEKVALSSLS